MNKSFAGWVMALPFLAAAGSSSIITGDPVAASVAGSSTAVSAGMSIGTGSSVTAALPSALEVEVSSVRTSSAIAIRTDHPGTFIILR